MVTLTATALTYRTFSRSNQAIVQRQQQVIYNAATPAIDRAKAKLEFMFRNDNRFPSGVPSSDQLTNMMLPFTEEAQIDGASVLSLTNLGYDADGDGDVAADPYTLPGETRLKLPITGADDDEVVANAWMYRSEDIDGDDDGEYVIYSIISDHQGPLDGDAVDITEADDETKAEALVTRTGPLATTEATATCKGARSQAGWQVVTAGDNASLQKNFQVNAIVVKSTDVAAENPNPVVETLEFQQSRIAATANKWGAWFRYDLEIHPGPDFNWNGAMHTDGNLILEKPDNDGITLFMVSSQNSCVYSQEASEVTLGEFDENDGTAGLALDYNAGEIGDFQGQAISARMSTDEYMAANDDVVVHVFAGDGNAPDQEDFDVDSDSVTPQANSRPSDVAMNPLILFTEGRESHNAPAQWERDDAAWEPPANGGTGVFTVEDAERIDNEKTTRPFVDDFFRADNRWGPKPRYDSRTKAFDVTQRSETIGDDIPAALTGLMGDKEGLDGFWERQSIYKGLRVIVGQRLELGNANGWNYDPTGVLDDVNVNAEGDPLYPPKAIYEDLNNINTQDFDANNDPPADRNDLHTDDASTRPGGNTEHLQRRSLRDNLAAVQGMVVYHYEINDGEFPAACMALTAHPGTERSIIDSRTFENYASTSVQKFDFLNGKGTNGWEFRFPDDFDTASEFATEIASGQPLGDALRNWAYFAGDPKGGAPSFKPVQDGDVHPYPYMSMWGDASALRRIFEDYLDASSPTTYANLSSADKATLHSAACTVSLLAYNIDKGIDEFESVAGDNLTSIGQAFWTLIDPGTSNGTFPAGNSGSDLSNLVGDIYTTFDSTHPLYPDEPVILTSDIPARADWTEDTAELSACPDLGETDSEDFEVGCDEQQYYDQFSAEDFIRAYIYSQPVAQINTTLAEVAKIRSFIAGYQIRRDRALGFIRGPLPPALAFEPGDQVPWDETTLSTVPAVNGELEGKKYSTSCDPDIFLGITGNGDGKATKKVGLATAFCSTKLDTKYPSLYYLFPLLDHDHDGTDDSAVAGGYDHTQPSAEEYVAATYVRTTNGVADTAADKRFKVLTDAEITGIAAEPGLSDTSDWVLPAATTAAGLTNPDATDQAFRIETSAGSGIDVSFLDKGMYDGRELLNVRVLDMDIQRLTGTDAGSDKWLSSDLENQAEGIVYAFREDAVREDEIVRPANASATAAGCRAVDRSQHPRLFAIERDASCYMQTDPIITTAQYTADGVTYTPQDPPLTAERISFKPVDFVPDPDRRPYGFRLRTGDGSPADFSNGDREVGMTFVTDNSLYILGDFNVHSSDGSTTAANLLEEFTDTILPGGFTFAEFYGDRLDTELDLDSFADPDVDHWRPVELLSDAISVLSNDFEDGAVEDTYTDGAGRSSYHNQPRPIRDASSETWIRENAEANKNALGAADDSPVFVDRNGTYYFQILDPTDTTPRAKDLYWPSRPFYQKYDTDAQWLDLDEDGRAQGASETYINATFVSGIVPTRPRQAYGGLHNYPRFLQEWGDNALYIQGSFIQLDFSTASTGPQDQDALEPGDTPVDDEVIDFYDAPQRNFGFDVALLYVPPAPAAERFVTIGSPRSEYYREVAADDPYVELLRCAKDVDGNDVLPAALCPS